MFSGDKKTITTLGLILGGFVIAQTALLAYWTRLKKNDEQLASELEKAKLELEKAKHKLILEADKKNVSKTSTQDSLATPMSPSIVSAPLKKEGKSDKPVRVYMDGCFDMMHYGHSNAIRQAKACGDILVVGLVNDEDIIKNKGSAPVMCEEERYLALSACKWVDEVIRNAPYDLTKEWVDKLISDYDIDYVVHGDDPCFTADGQDAYAYAKSIGVYREFKRTEGVSTTDIVGRMLLMTKEHHLPPAGEKSTAVVSTRGLRSSSLSVPGNASELDASIEGPPANLVVTQALESLSHNKFLPTARRIMQFAEGKVPTKDDKVVYMSGGWDLFSAGHVAILEQAKKHGSFLLVGIHDDYTMNKLRGKGLPILNLYERALSLLSCKVVDEVILGAPWVITEDLIKSMNISVVVKGTSSDLENADAHKELGLSHCPSDVDIALEKAYEVPKKLGILRTVKSPYPDLTALSIVTRILRQREAFQNRYEKKSNMEQQYNANKAYIEEA